MLIQPTLVLQPKLYLLDANMLISAYEHYYPITQLWPFWQWLRQCGRTGLIKVPHFIYSEVTPPPDNPMNDWINRKDVQRDLVLYEYPEVEALNDVVVAGYAPDLTEAELNQIHNDASLVAIARSENSRVIVTKERPSKNARRAKRKIPDVCDQLEVLWLSDFDLFFRHLNFHIPTSSQLSTGH